MDLADKDLETYLNFKPITSTDYATRSNVKLRMQDTLGAINDISKAIGLDPDNIELFLTRGHYYFSKGNYKKAIEDYNVCLINDRTNYIAFEKRRSLCCFRNLQCCHRGLHKCNKIK